MRGKGFFFEKRSKKLLSLWPGGVAPPGARRQEFWVFVQKKDKRLTQLRAPACPDGNKQTQYRAHAAKNEPGGGRRWPVLSCVPWVKGETVSLSVTLQSAFFELSCMSRLL
jgi:hypothetical protein